MEFLRDEDIEKVESVTETSNDESIIDSGAEMESRLGDPAVELETPETMPDNQGRKNKDTNGKRLRWLHFIGEHKDIQEVYLLLFSEKKILPFTVLLVCLMYAAVAAIFYFE